ncbi:MAG: TMEM175 family protein [Methanolinea sp.]|nr:TMEM175 family protein [Methanolinea sp.]
METIGKSRLEALSDGIFAIAMTLLVLSLTVPEIPPDQAPSLLPGRIASLFPEFMLFVIAFFILAGYWASHHRILENVRCVDGPLVRINIFLLFSIVLIPFTTSISGDYTNVLEAVLLFHANLLASSLLLSGMAVYIVRKKGVLAPGMDSREALDLSRSVIIPLVIALAIAISFFDPPGSMWCYALIPFILLGIRFHAGRISREGENEKESFVGKTRL